MMAARSDAGNENPSLSTLLAFAVISFMWTAPPVLRFFQQQRPARARGCGSCCRVGAHLYYHFHLRDCVLICRWWLTSVKPYLFFLCDSQYNESWIDPCLQKGGNRHSHAMETYGSHQGVQIYTPSKQTLSKLSYVGRILYSMSPRSTTGASTSSTTSEE